MALIAVSSFIAAALTVPAGFGLSTILTPLVLLIMPPHEAIAVVALVHAAHNGAKTISHVGEHRVLSIQEIWNLARGRFDIGC